MVTYTGGICGTFILFLFPLALVYFGRKTLTHTGNNKENPNASTFQACGWLILILAFSITTLGFVFTGIITGTAGE